MTYIRRKITDKIAEAHAYFPVIMLTGPRQSGKTTLCRHLYPDYKFVNLELITMRRRAKDDPEGFIDSLGQKAIIDEAHNVPEILSVFQARVDENKDLRYILTNSSNFALIRDVGQSLAGRAGPDGCGWFYRVGNASTGTVLNSFPYSDTPPRWFSTKIHYFYDIF